MNPLCYNCGTCTDFILADRTHSITEDAIIEEYDGEKYYSVPGWVCLDCAPPEIRELFIGQKTERILH